MEKDFHGVAERLEVTLGNRIKEFRFFPHDSGGFEDATVRRQFRDLDVNHPFLPLWNDVIFSMHEKGRLLSVWHNLKEFGKW